MIFYPGDRKSPLARLALAPWRPSRYLYERYPLHTEYSFNPRSQIINQSTHFINEQLYMHFVTAPEIGYLNLLEWFKERLRGGPFSVSLVAQILDPYVIVGRTTAIYNRRDLQKQGPYVELIILDITIYYTWPLRATYAAYSLYQSLLSTYTPNTLRPLTS